MAKRKRRLAIAATALFGVGLVGYLVWYGLAARELALEWDRAAKLGLAKTSAELNGKAPASSENAATEFKAAVDAYKAVPYNDYKALFSDVNFPQPEMRVGKAKPYVPPSKVEIAQAIASLGPAFNHLQKGARQPRYYADQDWEQPWDSEFGFVRRPADALVKAAFWRAYYGDLDGALADLSVVRKVAAIAVQQPYLNFKMSGVRLEAVSDRTVVMIAFHHRRSPEALAKVRAFLEAAPSDFEFADAMAVEAKSMAWGTRMLGEDPRKVGLKDDDLSIYQLPFRLAPVNMSQQAKVVRICRETYERNRGMGRDFVSMLKNYAETDPDKAARWQWNDVIELYYPDLDFTYEIQVGASAQVLRRLCFAAIDVIAVYGKTGRLPEQLPAGSKMADPFTGKPIRFATVKNRFVLYSAGVDGKNGELDRHTRRPDYIRHWSLWIPPLEDPVLGVRAD